MTPSGVPRGAASSAWKPRPLGSPAKYLAGMSPMASSRASPVPKMIKEEHAERLGECLVIFEVIFLYTTPYSWASQNFCRLSYLQDSVWMVFAA